MFYMLSCFDIRPDHTLAECRTSFLKYAEHMQQLDLIVDSGQIGLRQSDTLLDTDDQRTQQFFHITRFRDKPQSDRAVDYIASLQEPGRSIHTALYSKLENLVFVCWEDSSA